MADLLACRAALPRAAARAGRRAGSDGPGPDPAHAPRRPDRPVQRRRPVHGAAAGGLLAASTPAGRRCARPGLRAPSRCPTPAISACAAQGELLLVDCGAAGAGLPARPRPLRPAVVRVVDRRTAHRRRPGHAPVHGRPAPAGQPQHAQPQHGGRSTAPSSRTSTAPSAAGGARRPMLRSFEAGGDGLRLRRQPRRLRPPAGPPQARSDDRGPARLDRDPGPDRGRWAARRQRPPAAAPRLQRSRSRGGEPLIRSGPVTVRLAASAPLIAAEPAEWYPDIYVAEPTTRLVLPVDPGEGGLELRLERVDAGRGRPMLREDTMPDPALAGEPRR